jgi:predicted  nucleic acid-binding Zn-ribbon protein
VCKARYGLSDTGFDAFLSIIADMLPKENKVPANTYYTKKLISPLTMGVEKIHVCRNHCILYRGADYMNLDSCPNCGVSRYKMNKDYREEERAASLCKGKKRKRTQQKTQKSSSKPTSKEKQEVDYYTQKKIPALVIWYLPVVDQLGCLFANPKDAKLMSWYVSDEHKDDGKLRHPADGQQWKDFNENHKDFAKELRNVRFTLSTDGMNPFAERSSKHNTWPVILIIYNLPLWLIPGMKTVRIFIRPSIRPNKYEHLSG